MRLHLPFTALAITAALAGCGSDPYRASLPQPAAPTPPTAPAQPDAPGPPPPDVSSSDAIHRFAQAWITWDAEDLPRTQAALANQATGGLRATLLAEARRAAADQTVRPALGSSRGRVEGILERPGRPTLVVTRETIRVGDGRAAQVDYGLYLARAARTPGGWKLTAWRPAQ